MDYKNQWLIEMDDLIFNQPKINLKNPYTPTETSI